MEESYFNEAYYIKKKLVPELLEIAGEVDFTNLNICYHGVNVSLTLETKKLHHAFIEGIPKSWQIAAESKFEPELNITWLDASKRIANPNDYDFDPYPEYRFEVENNKRLIIQRDLIAIEKSPENFHVMTLPEVTDGFFNVFRLILPKFLLKQNSLVLHSSCVVGRDGYARVFLGESNAGKSTTSRLSEPRKILGDDINIFHFDGDTVYASSAFIGGNPIYKIPFDQKIPVKGFFWIHKDKSNWIKPTTRLEKIKFLFMSLFLWTPIEDTESLSNETLDFLSRIESSIDMKHLGFRLDNTFWHLLDEEDNHVTA